MTKTLEKLTYEEEVSDGEKESNLSKPSVQEVRADETSKPPTSSDHLDVDESVDALLTDVKEPGTDKQSDKGESLGDFPEAVKNDLKSEERGPPVHEELAKIVTRLIRDGMLEDKLQDKLNKYPQPENCEGLTKVGVNQLMWDNLSPGIRSQDLKFQKVQRSLVKGMTVLARVADAVLKRANDINGGKAVAQEAIDSLSLLAHANTELNTRRKELIKPDFHSDYKHLCSVSTTVTDKLFGEDLSKQVKDIFAVNRVGRQVTSTVHHRAQNQTQFGYKFQSFSSKRKFFRARGNQKHFLGWRKTANRGQPSQSQVNHKQKTQSQRE